MTRDQVFGKLLPITFAAILVAIDQWIKIWALRVLPPVYTIEIIPRFFRFTYVENRGAAFGLLQDKTSLLSVVTGVILLGLLVWILITKMQNRFLLWSVSMVAAGGIGNLLDRITRGFVVDYLDFSPLFGFPVFNFADCCVVVGTLLIICCVAWTDFSSAKKKIPPTGLSEKDKG